MICFYSIINRYSDHQADCLPILTSECLLLLLFILLFLGTDKQREKFGPMV